MREFFSKIPWKVLIIACLTLGLAPFSPPHIREKLHMLSKGQLINPMDWFDLFFPRNAMDNTDANNLISAA